MKLIAFFFSDPETAAAWLTALTGLAWLALLAVPFAPGLIELLYPRDNAPLNINWNFVKDPFYFFKSFRAIMQAKAYYFYKDSVTVQIDLSRPESVDVHRRLTGPAGEDYPNIVYAKEDLSCGEGSFFCKEVYCLGNIEAGAGSAFRAVGCEGSLRLGAGSSVTRWAAAEGPLYAEAGVNLGINAASHKSLTLEAGCLFSSLFAPEIRTGSFSSAPENALSRLSDEEPAAGRPGGHIIQGSIVTKEPLHINSGTIMNASVKSHTRVILENGVTVLGGVFSEGDIILGADCRVKGNLFAQGKITIADGCVIGSPGGIKSVIAKKGVFLAGNVTVFGQIKTQGRGEVLK